MRGILLNVRHAPEDGILLASSGNAENIDQWLKELRLTGMSSLTFASRTNTFNNKFSSRPNA